MADTLKRLFGPANIANGTSTLFTGTAAHVYTIVGIVIVNNTGGDIQLKLGIQPSAGALTDDQLFLPNSVIDAGGMATFDGKIMLTGTEVIRAVASATGLTIEASGLDQG